MPESRHKFGRSNFWSIFFRFGCWELTDLKHKRLALKKTAKSKLKMCCLRQKLITGYWLGVAEERRSIVGYL